MRLSAPPETYSVVLREPIHASTPAVRNMDAGRGEKRWDSQVSGQGRERREACEAICSLCQALSSTWFPTSAPFFLLVSVNPCLLPPHPRQ